MPRQDADGVRLEIFSTFEASEAVWRRIESQSFCHVFQTFAWLAAWYRTIGKEERVTPCIVHALDPNGVSIMLLPLAIYRRNGLAFLSFAGGVVTDYHAPLLAGELAQPDDVVFATRLLARVLAAVPGIDVIAFERMPPLLGDRRNPFAHLAGATHVWSAHLARLPASFEAFRKARKSKLFTDTARRWRLLNEIGQAQIELVKTPEMVTAAFAAFARQKRRRWDEAGARNLFASPGYLEFYRSLVDGTLAKWGHMAALRVGDTIVATHLGAVFRGRFYYLMPGHEAGEWSRYSVGRQLLKWLVEWSIASGLTEFDLTVGDEEFKAEWADLSVPLHDYMRGATLRGRLYCRAIDSREWLRVRAKRVEWLCRIVKCIRNARLRSATRR